MGAREIELKDVHSGPPPSRKRLLAPLRYLSIRHPEKTLYDFVVPALWAVVLFAGYWLIEPKPALFADGGLIKLGRGSIVSRRRVADASPVHLLPARLPLLRCAHALNCLRWRKPLSRRGHRVDGS